MQKLTVYLLLFSFYEAGGQSMQPRMLVSDSAANVWFFNQRRVLPVYNGRVYHGYPDIKSHALYPSNKWQNGSVLYEGMWYHDIAMMYDVYKDEVITLHPNNSPVRLFMERVEQFSFEGLTFVRLAADRDNVIKNGLYQLLVDGPVTVFVRRSKIIKERIEDVIMEREFVSTDQFYVLKEGVYTLITRKKTMLVLLKSKRKPILRHLRQQGLKFKKNKEKSIVQMAEFYNQSNK